METMKLALSTFQAALRYLASGFVVMSVLLFRDPEGNGLWYALLKESPWFVGLFAGLIGIFVYSVHNAVLDELFYRITIAILVKIRNVPLPEALKDLSITEIKFNLTTQRWSRRESEIAHIRSMQNAADQQLSMLSFLYCASYSMILVPTVCHIFFTWKNSRSWWLAVISGLCVFFSAIIFDYRVMKRDIWMASRYFDICIAHPSSIQQMPSNAIPSVESSVNPIASIALNEQTTAVIS